MFDIHSSNNTDLALRRFQTEIESLTIENEERQAGCVRCKQTHRQGRSAERGPRFHLEGPQHAQHSPDEGHWDF